MAENIYSKLQQIRCAFVRDGLKKSGANKFSGYTYFEAEDFLPQAMILFEQHKLFSYVTFPSRELAVLTIINTENPEEKIIFEHPMGKAELKACHDAQNVGAMLTYAKRYLYLNALELTEHDNIETSQPVQQKADTENIDTLKEKIKQATENIGELASKSGKDYRSAIADVIRKHYKIANYMAMKSGDEKIARDIVKDLRVLYRQAKTDSTKDDGESE